MSANSQFSTVNSPLIPPGYKQTEVGVIPEEWEVKPLGEIGGVRMCKRVFKHQTREIGDVPFYKIGTFGDVPDAFIPHELFDEFKRKYSFPRKGDVLISAAGTIGRTVVYDGVPAYFQDSNIVWIDNDQSKATNEYLRHYYQVTKWSVSHGGTIARLYNDNLKNKIHVAIPPLPEQRAIATALSDVDGLLGGLDRLIAKKSDLKQAAMQQLLTGQTRLPGFHGEWEVRTLHEVCHKVQDGTHFSPKLGGNDYLYVTSKNIRFGTLDISTAERISAVEHDKIYARCDVRKGDLLLTKDGANTGNAALNPLDDPFSLLSSVALLRFDDRRHTAAYFMYQLLSTHGQEQIKGNDERERNH